MARLALPIPAIGMMPQGVVGKLWPKHIKCLAQCHSLLPLGPRSTSFPAYWYHTVVTPGFQQNFSSPPTHRPVQVPEILPISHLIFLQSTLKPLLWSSSERLPRRTDRNIIICHHNATHFIKDKRKSTTYDRNKTFAIPLCLWRVLPAYF